MIFKSEIVKSQWDTWGYYHEGRYYLYYLIADGHTWDGFGVATSTDGAHWQDHGWAIRASDQMVEYLGTGAVWPAADFAQSRRFICNYSEWRAGENGEKPTQNILFAWSEDLIHWHKYGDEFMFRVDERYYEPQGRWDCIFPIPREGGGYYGTWTATPKGRANMNAGIGFGYSGDGLHWTALPPAEVVPDADEAGAFLRFGERVYAMLGKWDTGMVCYVADAVTGPYRRAETNAVLLGGGMRHTYFARFFPTPRGVLVNHHAMNGAQVDGRPITYAAPLKLAVVQDGVLRWRYWLGNDALKGEEIAALDATADFARGIVVEGTMRRPSTGEWCGLRLSAGDHSSAIRVYHDGHVEMGPSDQEGNGWEIQQSANREWRFGERAHFRLLARRGMLEFYLDDQFIECYRMGCPDARTVCCASLGGNVSDICAWQMSL
jgi:hypothetical protein